MKKRLVTWGLEGLTETHWVQPCCFSSEMRGRMWRPTLTEQFSDDDDDDDVSIGC